MPSGNGYGQDNNIMDQVGIGAPPLSLANTGRIYFDSALGVFRVSENGAAFANLVGGSGASFVSAILSSDFTVNNQATPQDVTGFSFPILANEKWVCNFNLFEDVAVGGQGYRIDFTGPAGASVLYYDPAGNYVGQVSGSNFENAFGNDLVFTTSGSFANLIAFTILNGATPGTVQLRFAQKTADVSNASIKATSSMIAQKVS